MPSVHVHQILNYYTPREALDPGFLVLDNSSNERPDWYEYWPMRKFLREEPLDEDAFYGFLSPEVPLKTNLSAAQVREFIERAASRHRRFPVQSEHSQQRVLLERVRARRVRAPGLLRQSPRASSRASIRRRGSTSSSPIRAIPCIRIFRREAAVLAGVARGQRAAVRDRGGSRRPPRRGAAHAHRLSRQRQRADEDLHHGAHGDVAPLPRCAFRAQARDPFAARSRIYKLPLAVVCDALKIAYATQGRGQYKDVFLMLQTGTRAVEFPGAHGRAARSIARAAVAPRAQVLLAVERALKP
jgi:hypothetical protein